MAAAPKQRNKNLLGCRLNHEKRIMYERFTDRARKVMQLANQESKRLRDGYIGTEHVLLGLVKEGTGVASCVLRKLDIDPQQTRLEVAAILPKGPDMAPLPKPPTTRTAKDAIGYSWKRLAI